MDNVYWNTSTKLKYHSTSKENMKYRKLASILAISALSVTLASCGTHTTTKYNDARSSYNGSATIQNLDSKKESKRHSTGKGKKQTITTIVYSANVCPEETSGIPCYKQTIDRHEYEKLAEGMKVQLVNGNVDLPK